MPKLSIQPLDLRIREILLRQILTGELAPGTNLTEARLADELGASRTPLRNALIRLQQEGLLVLEPNRGFFVAPLSAEEAHELYPILSTLEQMALRAAPPDADGLRQLRRQNDAFATAPPDQPDTVVQLNFEWHEQLLSRCPNRRLMEIIGSVRGQVYRYELAFFSPGAKRLAKSVELHRRIMQGLEANDLDEACRHLEAHWAADLDAIV